MQAALASTAKSSIAPITIPLHQERAASCKTTCTDCVLGKICLPQLFTTMPFDTMSAHLNTLVRQNKGVMHGKDVLYRQGGQFDALYVVRSGAVKTTYTDRDGETSVTGFYLPGDILGLDGISTGHYTNTAMVLDTSSLCTLPFAALEKVATQVPDVQRHVFRIMAQEIQNEQRRLLMLNRKNAEQRVAAFLLQLSNNLNHYRLANDNFRLPMSRLDMSNYLGMAVETLCRVLSKFERQGLLKSEARYISELDFSGLETVLAQAS